MIKVEAADGGFVVRVGPLDESTAEKLAEALRALGAPSDLVAMPINVLRAIAKGERHLEEDAGHYSVRVDGGPGAPRKVDYSAGGTIRIRLA